MATFIAVIRQGAAAHTASFPDFPELAVNGQTLDELLAKASDVLAAHVESLLEAGKAIGSPTPAVAIERGDALLLAAVEVPDDLRLANVVLEIPALALTRIDAFARRQGLTRSALFVLAVNRLEMEGSLPGDRRSEISDHPKLSDFAHPLELKVEAAMAVYPPLQAAADESAGQGIAEGGIADIAEELERLVERSSKANLQDAVERRSTRSKKSE